LAFALSLCAKNNNLERVRERKDLIDLPALLFAAPSKKNALAAVRAPAHKEPPL
jgi:hypothetical protein